MTALLVLLALALFALLLGAVVLPRQTSFPASYAFTPAEMHGLSADESARIEAWSREVEALGFRRFGEYRADVLLGRDDGAWRILHQLRAWRSPDGLERAFASHVVVLRPTGGTSSSAWLQLAFESRRQDGGFHTTHNCGPLDDRLLRPPGWTSRVAHGLDDVRALHALHRQSPLEPRVELGVDLPSDVAAAWAWKTGYALDRGLVRRDGDRLRATARMGLRQAARILNPFALETLPHGSTALRLGALALLALAGAAALGAPPAPAWAPPSLFAAVGLLASTLLRRSAPVAAAYVLLPSELLLDLRGHPTVWAWAAGLFATAAGVAACQRLSYRSTATRMGLPMPGPGPLGPRARLGWSLAFAAASAAAGAAAWVARHPMQDWPVTTLVLVVFVPGATLLFLVTSLLSFKSGLARTPGFRTLRLASLSLLLPVLGAGAGLMLAKRDREKTDAARAAIVEALERYRSREAGYPWRLDQLVPVDLPSLPKARQGWREIDFRYELASPPRAEKYVLSP